MNRTFKLSDVIQFNPVEHLSKGTYCKKVPMEYLCPFTRHISSYQDNVAFTGGSKFRNGDTLLARITPCLENGKTAKVDFLNENEIAFGSTEFIVLRAKLGMTDENFIYYLATSPEFRNIAIKSMVGSSGRQRVQQDVLENTIIELPDLSTQKQIAQILSSLDDKIELNTRINRNLEQQAQAIFKSWFVDFEPFQDGKFVDSEFGKIPEGWQNGHLKDIAQITMGQSPSGDSYNEIGEGTVFYQGRAEFGERFPTRRLFTTSPKRMAKAGDVLLSVRAPVGDLNTSFEDCCIGRGLAALHSANNCPSYLTYQMNMLKPQLESFNAEGTVFGCINKDSLHDIPILLPPYHLQRKYEEVVSPIEKLLKDNYLSTYYLQIIRDTLLPKLMSGEIDVSEVEV